MRAVADGRVRGSFSVGLGGVGAALGIEGEAMAAIEVDHGTAIDASGDPSLPIDAFVYSHTHSLQAFTRTVRCLPLSHLSASSSAGMNDCRPCASLGTNPKNLVTFALIDI